MKLTCQMLVNLPCLLDNLTNCTGDVRPAGLTVILVTWLAIIGSSCKFILYLSPEFAPVI